LLGLALLAGAAAFISPRARGVAREAARAGGRTTAAGVTVARNLRKTADSVGEAGRHRAGTVTRGLGRALTLPVDRTLALAREHLMGELPEAADTKWRISQLALRAAVVSAAAGDADAGPAMLDDAGEAYGAASAPDGAWTPLHLLEAARRLTRALELDGGVHRSGRVIEIVTTGCAFLDVARAAPAGPPGEAVCAAVCGESSSLLHGLASVAGARVETEQRMGAGDERCLRRLTMATPDEATG
jgi:hypothetical protein